MKWIKIADNHHKLVADTDPRPEDKAFASKPPKPGAPAFVTKPSWGVFERAMQSDNAAVQKAATDMFLDAREREMATSTRARHWENDRKRAWAKDKPAWRKKQEVDA